MSEARVIKATFADWRPVKSRKVLQIILELPLEQTQDVLTRLGAPMPDQEKWVAVALLDPKAQLRDMLERSLEHENTNIRVIDPEMERARKYSVLLAKKPEFWWWANKTNAFVKVDDEKTAAGFIREWCGIDTRGKIATDRNAFLAFERLRDKFERATGRAAEIRG